MLSFFCFFPSILVLTDDQTKTGVMNSDDAAWILTNAFLILTIQSGAPTKILLPKLNNSRFRPAEHTLFVHIHPDPILLCKNFSTTAYRAPSHTNSVGWRQSDRVL